METETISSSMTFFAKFVLLPLVWTGFGLVTVAIFLSAQPRDLQIRWQFAVGWVIGSALCAWEGARLKRVQLEGCTLVISNYRDEIGVHASDIADVSQTLLRGRPVTVTFKKPTLFGSSITFIPKGLSPIFSDAEIVTRLRNLANLYGSGSP